MDWIDGFLSSGIRMTTPILLAALGGLPTMWTRDINIGLEGIMTFGAFFGVVFGLLTGATLPAILLVLVLAAVCGLLFGLAVVKLKLNVFVGGVVLYVFSGAATVYLLFAWFGVRGTLTDPRVPQLPSFDFLQLPVLGAIVSGHTVLTWVAWVLLAVLAFLAPRLVLIRRMRASGVHPVALETAGVSVTRLRLLAQVWCFLLATLAGVEISLGQLSLYTVGMTGGLGFVALAAMILSGGRVLRAAAASLIFGFASALTFQVDKNVFPPELTAIVPYVLAFVALIVMTRRPGSRPRALRPPRAAIPGRRG